MNSTKNQKEFLLQVGEKGVVEFSDVSYEGLGVCKVNAIDLKGTYYENYPMFVEGALYNEKGIVEIIKINKTFANAKLVKLFNDSYSKYRISPICPHYIDCGGCDIMHMNYTGQLVFKRKIVKDAFERIALLKDVEVLNTIGMERPNYYRNKVQMPVASRYGKAVVGFYKKNTHDVFPITKCYIQDEKSCEMANFIKNLLNEFKVQAYDEKFKANNKDGAIRHIVIKLSKLTNKVMVILVSTSNTLPYKDEIIKKLISRYNNISSVVLNVNKLATPNVLTNESIVLYGDDYLEEELCGLKFKIGITSFFQVNNEQTEKLYNKVIELGYIKKDDCVIDAYCGIGTISLMLAKHAKHVYGVEVIEEAIKNAKDNAKLNNIKNVTFEAGLAEEVVKKWKDKANVLVVDPPRKGIDESLINTILNTNFERIVYVSCNPTTLARDVRMLSEKYKVKVIQPVDMFPHTHHVETVVLLYHK